MNGKDEEGPADPPEARGPFYRMFPLLALFSLIALVPRLLLISWEFNPNGVDEGIQLMAGRMMSEGFSFYSEINTVQPPLMLSLYGILDIGPVGFRVLSSVLSIGILLMVMYLGYRLGGRMVMLTAGALLTADIMFLQESRLASLDMFSLFFVVLSLLLFVLYRDRGNRLYLMFSGVCVGLATMTKLYGAVAGAGILLVILVDMAARSHKGEKGRVWRWLPPRDGRSAGISDVLAFGAPLVLVVFVSTALFGMEEVFRGIVLNQLERPVDTLPARIWVFTKYLLVTPLSVFFFIFGVRRFWKKKEGVLLVVGGLYLLAFLIQAKTFTHHLIFLSPFLALGGGLGIMNLVERIGKNLRTKPKTSIYHRAPQAVALILACLVCAGFSVTVFATGEPASRQLSNMVRDLTEEGDYIISGDPMIPALAYRLTPPGIVNVATVQHPVLTDDDLNESLIDYGVRCVILSHNLLDHEGFLQMVLDNFKLRAHFIGDTTPTDGEKEHFWLYTLDEEAALLSHPEWGSEL